MSGLWSVVIVGTMLAASAMQVLVRLPSMTIPADSSSFSTTIDLATARAQLLTLDSAYDVVLDLDGIETERSPAGYFEVYVHLCGRPRGHSVGNLVLYGSGIRSEARGALQPAHVALVITDQIRAALPTSSTVTVTFLAQGAGGPPARSVSAVTIRTPEVRIVSRTRE
jgi:hypothetical protein